MSYVISYTYFRCPIRAWEIVCAMLITDPITYTWDHSVVCNPCTNTLRQFGVLGSHIIAATAWWIAHGLLLTSVMLKLALRHEPIKWRAPSRKPDDQTHVQICQSSTPRSKFTSLLLRRCTLWTEMLSKVEVSRNVCVTAHCGVWLSWYDPYSALLWRLIDGSAVVGR